MLGSCAGSARPGLPGLDLAALEAFLGTRRPGLVRGTLHAELVAGGRSNLTYRLTDGRRRLILRRPPLGHVLATAHDMSREVRVLTGLAGTPVPVPEVLLSCQDAGVLGAPFYVMAEVPGRVLRSADDVTQLPPDERRSLGEALADVLARLHSVDPESVGLADLGRPDGFLARQVRRWGRQLAASRSRDVAGIDDLRAALAADVPSAGGVAIVHGDFRLDNVLVVPGAGIAAVLDWEMATLGDPLTDLATLVVYRQALPAGADAISDAMSAPGFPTAAELVSTYVERRHCDVSALAWYTGLAAFKLAVILEGIHFRYVQGQTVGAGFDRIGTLVEPLVATGLGCLRSGRLPGSAGSDMAAPT